VNAQYSAKYVLDGRINFRLSTCPLSHGRDHPDITFDMYANKTLSDINQVGQCVLVLWFNCWYKKCLLVENIRRNPQTSNRTGDFRVRDIISKLAKQIYAGGFEFGVCFFIAKVDYFVLWKVHLIIGQIIFLASDEFVKFGKDNDNGD
jgi:hypothetical protein